MSDSDLQGFTAEQTTEPTYPQYTNLGLGQGTFDQLMTAIKYHLDEQFDMNRITGPQYAEVYVQALQAAMTNATQYLLGILFADQQKAKFEAETSLIEKQELEIDAKIDLLELEEEKLKFQLEQLFPLEKLKLEAEVLLTQKQSSLIDKQIEKIDQEILVMVEQVLNSAKQRDKMDAEITHLGFQNTLLTAQTAKVNKEIELLDAKIATELGNTQNVTAGLIGRQMSLLTAQKYAFAGDIRVKISKLHADYQAVFQSVQEVPTQSALTGTAVGTAADSVASSIMGA
jgi:hypothetical protein